MWASAKFLFVLSGCPWRCRYCDTPGSLVKTGIRPCRFKDVLDKILELQAARDHGAVSVTGGEPLLQSEFLAALLPAIKTTLGFKTYLETSATHPHLSTRWPPLRRGGRGHQTAVRHRTSLWAEHEEFLRLAGIGRSLKLSSPAETTEDEIETAVNLLSRLTPVPPLVLQPVTPMAELEGRLQEAGVAARWGGSCPRAGPTGGVLGLGPQRASRW
jgi:7-carboxy-7-deazaguanine synthase